jgi:hypothetical protein
VSTGSLWPREHGAYAELAFPLATGLAVAGPSLSGACLAVGAATVFLAHEPLAILSGMRGARLQRDLGKVAVQRLALLVGLGVVGGTCGALLGGPDVRTALYVPLLPAVALLPWMMRRRQKTLPAEILIIAVFAGAVVPLVIAGGGSWTVGWIAAGVWFTSFALGTIAVHGLKVYHKCRAGASRLRGSALVLAVVVPAGMLVGAVTGHVPVLAAIAVIPPVAVTAAVAAVPVHPRRLKLVGWSLVSANALTLTCLLLL